MRPIKRKKLRFQLLVFVLPLVALAVIITSGVLSWYNYRHFKKNIQQNYQYILKSAVGEIGFFMNSALEGLQSLGMIITAAKTDPWQTDIALAAFAQTNSVFEVVTLYDLQGEKMVSTQPEGEETAVPDPSTFDRARTGQFSVSRVQITRDHVPYVYLAVPVFRRGKIHGVLWGELNLTSVWYVLERIRIGRTGKVYIVDLSGQYVCHPQIDFVVCEPPKEKPRFLEAVKNSPEPVEWIDRGGTTPAFSLGATIENFDWVVVFHQELPEIYGYLRQNIFWAVVITLVVMYFAALLVGVVVHWFLNPLQALHRRVQQVGEGNLNPDFDLHGPDEIGDLARAFNSMVASLRRYIRREIDNTRELTHNRNLAVLGTTASKVTHEVGNLINNISMALMVLRRERLSDRGRNTLDTLGKEADRIQHFILNFLQFAKKPELKLETRSLCVTLRELHTAQKPAAQSRGVRIVLDCDDELPPVTADHYMLYQAFNNLLKNSLEAMDTGGRVTLSAGIEDDAVVVSVADTGPGMRAETRGKLFEPFFTTKGKKGTGLGMAITRSIVQAHGGTIDCDSEPSNGTRFVIRLPMRGISPEKPA